MPDAYRELEEMGVNIAAVKEANLTEIELIDLTKVLRRLFRNHGATSSKRVIDVA